jgi:hypothetical protein
MSSETNSSSDTDSIGEFVINAIAQADSLLNGVVDDPKIPNGKTLKVNVFLRDNFLDEDGIFAINFDDDSSGDFNPVIYYGEDRLSKTSIRINSVRVTGLDTMTTFNPLIEIGQYTFLNELKWDRLSIAFDLTLDIGTSTLDESILINETPVKITENVTISLDLERVVVNASIFLAIDQNKFDTLPLGSLLKDPVVCFLSALDVMEISGLGVSLGQFSQPVADGFDSPGLDRIVKTLIEAAFQAYEPTLTRAVPYFFQVPIRNFIKSNFLDKWVGDQNECISKALEIPDTSVIDFRDLLLPSEEARSLGGTGQHPYGTLMYAIYDIVTEQYFAADPTTGLAAINSKFLADYGMRQSGTSGRLFFPGNLFNQERQIRTGGRDSYIRLRGYDAYIENIDTIGVPLQLLEPQNGDASFLNNEATIGLTRSLRIGFRFFLGISNSGMFKEKTNLCKSRVRHLTLFHFCCTESDIENDVDIFLDFKTFQVLLTLLARVSEKAFMTFPLQGTAVS